MAEPHVYRYENDTTAATVLTEEETSLNISALQQQSSFWKKTPPKTQNTYLDAEITNINLTVLDKNIVVL